MCEFVREGASVYECVGGGEYVCVCVREREGGKGECTCV